MLEFSNIDGRYRVSKLLYTRGVTSTYTALDLKNADREVLLDVAPVGELSTDRESYLENLSQLASLLGSLEHANIASIQGFFLDGPYFGLVKSYDPGELLADRLQAPEGEALSQGFDLRVHLCRDVLEGLATLHRVGVLHRDLSIRSLWMTQEAGSREVAQIDHFHAAVATYEDYKDPLGHFFSGPLAPEIQAGGSYSFQSDVFAVGMALVELLSTEKGPRGLGDLSVFETNLTELEIHQRVPKPYGEVLVRATRPSRLERFQDGLDFLAAFDAMDIQRRLGDL